MMREEWWQAIVRCDPRYDRQFYYGVVTTKIFCKPSCRSHPPKREHVRLFASPDAALKEGFRPCKRCKPDDPNWYVDHGIAEQIETLIEERYPESWTLASMAAALHMSPYHIHKMYRRARGKTPLATLQSKRIAVARQLLATSNETIGNIALNVGFRSSSHFATVFQKTMGCTPSQYRAQERK